MRGFDRQRTFIERRAGQSYVETALVVMLVSFVFFGLFQLAQVFAAHEILHHAAQRAARSRTVGFNRWMVAKVARVAAIPNAGAMIEPEETLIDPAVQAAIRELRPGALWDLFLGATPRSARVEIERARIPEYLASPHYAHAAYILDYADWDGIRHDHHGDIVNEEGETPLSFETRVRQRFPLLIAMHRAFYAPEPDSDGTDRVGLSGRVEIESHFPLYLDDRGW